MPTKTKLTAGNTERFRAKFRNGRHALTDDMGIYKTEGRYFLSISDRDGEEEYRHEIMYLEDLESLIEGAGRLHDAVVAISKSDESMELQRQEAACRDFGLTEEFIQKFKAIDAERRRSIVASIKDADELIKKHDNSTLQAKIAATSGLEAIRSLNIHPHNLGGAEEKYENIILLLDDRTN